MGLALVAAGLVLFGVMKPTVPEVSTLERIPSPNFFSQGFERECGADVVCSLNVIQELTATPNYRVEIRVEDLQTNEIVCLLEAELEALASDVMQAEGGKISMMLERTGDVVINGLVEDECSGADVNGRYRPQGL